MSLSTYTQMRAFVKKARKDNDNYLIMQAFVTFGLVPEVSSSFRAPLFVIPGPDPESLTSSLPQS